MLERLQWSKQQGLNIRRTAGFDPNHVHLLTVVKYFNFGWRQHTPFRDQSECHHTSLYVINTSVAKSSLKAKNVLISPENVKYFSKIITLMIYNFITYKYL